MKVLYRLYRLLTWAHHWISRRFTPAGILLLVALVMSAAVGVDMDQSVAFEGFVLALCLLTVSMGAAWFFRGRFEARRWLPRFGSVGQPLAYSIQIRNKTARAFRGLELLEDLSDPRPSLAEFASAQRAAARNRSFRLTLLDSPPLNVRQAAVRIASLPDLPASGEVEARMELVPLKRGSLRFQSVTVARLDPFGLFRAFVRVELPQKLLVLPRRYPVPAITLPGTRKYQHGGVALASVIGESDEFVSLREYRPGDPLRHIHWRSWARAGRPIVREFQDEFFVRHALVLDTFAGLERTAAFEEAVSVAASFACTLDTQESLLDLMFVGTQAVHFTTGRGLSHIEQALEILASVQTCREKPFHALQNLVVRHAGEVCGCICVFLDWDEPRRQLVRELQAMDLPVMVLVVAETDLAAKVRAEFGAKTPQTSDEPDMGARSFALRGDHGSAPRAEVDAPLHLDRAAFHVIEVGKAAEGLQELGR